MNFTPGPWRMHSVDGNRYYVLGPGDAPGFLCTLDEGNYNCQAANAVLMAAAPEMLAALKQADIFMSDDFPQGPDGPAIATDRSSWVLYRSAYKQVLAAIRKAEGKEE